MQHADDQPDPRAVRPAEAMRRLGGIARSTLYQLLDAGELNSYRIGRCRFVLVDSIDAFIERRIEAERQTAA